MRAPGEVRRRRAARLGALAGLLLLFAAVRAAAGEASPGPSATAAAPSPSLVPVAASPSPAVSPVVSPVVTPRTASPTPLLAERLAQLCNCLTYADDPAAAPDQPLDARLSAVRVLKTRNWNYRRSATDRAAAGEACLRALARDPDAAVRLEAASALRLDRVRIDPFPEKIQRLAGCLETEPSPEVLLAILDSLQSFAVSTGAEQMANLINGYRMEGKNRVPLANLARLTDEQNAEVRRRAVECFREMRPITEPRARLMVMFAVLSWSHEQPEADWPRLSAVIRHVVNRDGEPYAGWKLAEWRSWYNNRVNEERFRIQLESLKAQALAAMTEGDAARARQYYEKYGSIWQQIIEISDPQDRDVSEAHVGELSRIETEANDAINELQARLGLDLE